MNFEPNLKSDGRAPSRGRPIRDRTHEDKVAGLMKTQGLLLAITLAVALYTGAGPIPAKAQDTTVPPAPNDVNAPIDPIDNPYHVVVTPYMGKRVDAKLL